MKESTGKVMSVEKRKIHDIAVTRFNEINREYNKGHKEMSPTLKCPKCGSEQFRFVKSDHKGWRARKCLSCGEVWTKEGLPILDSEVDKK